MTSLDNALRCVDILSTARIAYNAQLTAAIAGYPRAPAAASDGPATPADPVAIGGAASAGAGGNMIDLPDSAAQAFIKLGDFEDAFFQDRVLTDPTLQICTSYLSMLPMESGYFGSHPPTFPSVPPIITDPINVCLNNPPPPPVEPPTNCMGVIATAWLSYNAGQVNKDDTTACADHDDEKAATTATGLTGPVAVAFGGARKAAKQSASGDNCEQASPLIQNFDMGIAVKPAGVFIPDQILVEKPGKAPEWAANKARMLYYVYPDKDGKPVKRGPLCRQDSEITVRTTANMSMPYYLHAMVASDKNGYSGGNAAYQALIDVHQRCYGPGTNLTNPNAFSIIPSENETKIALKVVPDCKTDQAWNANINAGASMGKDAGGSFGFSGGVSETKSCAMNRDLDNFASAGCFANQNFANVALTTKKLNGPFAIGSVYTLFNPNDQAPATAPVNFLMMGMQIVGGQVRATSSISTDAKGVAGAALATMLTNRKKIIDKPAAAQGQLKMGSPGCALFAGGNPRPANECEVPGADWPFIPQFALDKVPTAQKMTERFDQLVKQIKDAAER